MQHPLGIRWKFSVITYYTGLDSNGLSLLSPILFSGSRHYQKIRWDRSSIPSYMYNTCHIFRSHTFTNIYYQHSQQKHILKYKTAWWWPNTCVAFTKHCAPFLQWYILRHQTMGRDQKPEMLGNIKHLSAGTWFYVMTHNVSQESKCNSIYNSHLTSWLVKYIGLCFGTQSCPRTLK